jgi:cell division protease FtsH
MAPRDSSPVPEEKQPTGGKSRRNPPTLLTTQWWMWIAVVLSLFVYLLTRDQYLGNNRVPYSEFKVQLNRGNVKWVKLSTGQPLLQGEFYDPKLLPQDVRKGRKDDDKTFTSLRLQDDKDLSTQLLIARQNGPLESYDSTPDSSGLVATVLIYVLPVILILGVMMFLIPRMRDPMGGGFLSSYIKSPARRYEKGKTRVTFDDVAGMENAKAELREVVDFLKNPEKFHKLGGQIPKGVLLIGPPGTGKTLIARAVAGEAGVPFYSISGSEFIQMFVGVGASRVRDLFKTAREHSPCILFIDEIDAVGRVRGAGLGGGHDEREQTLNQILTEMDGFLPTESVIVLAATNRPDVLDPALLRPGRFDRHVTIDRPTWQGRLAILKVHTRDKPLAADVNLDQIARGTIGMTGADLRNLANEAALLATRAGRSKITRRDFEDASDRVVMGAKREEVMKVEDKYRTAIHESGHALCGFYEPKSDPLRKVTIVPRGRALGVTQFAPDDDKLEWTEEQLKAKLIMTLGGRAADKIVFNETSSGASQDLKQATRIARMMVTQFGMSDKLGPVNYRIGEEHVFLGKEIQESRDFSEGTMQLIDEEVRRIIREAEQRSMHHLEGHRKEMELLAQALILREELSKEEVDMLIKAGTLDVLPPIVVEEPAPSLTHPVPIKRSEVDAEPDVPGGLRPFPA